MLINLAAAAAYFYFNWCYYALVTAVLQRPPLRWFPVAGMFVLNYLLFFVCSVLELNLLINWGLFFIIQLAESLICCRDGWRVPLFLSLNGILHGLAINIFCRCVTAIAVSQPLAAFDNHVNSVGNLKWLPIFLGFIVSGVVLRLMARPKSLEQLRTLIAHPGHLNFQLELMAGMFLYLFLNLLLYQSRGDSVLLKLWGIKSVVFSLVGFYLGLRYSLKMCQLSDYREQNRTMKQKVTQSELEEQQLRSVAYRDMLTGAYSRQYAVDQMERMIRERVRFSLCFLDVDDLKGVNDQYGHIGGDRYLVTVARELASVCEGEQDVLARYGGDEFLILLPETEASVAEQRLQLVGLRLQELSDGVSDFPMSFSCGVVDSGDGNDAETLLAAADAKMYLEKKRKAPAKLHSIQAQKTRRP